MFELCQSLIRTEQLNTFYLIDGLVGLVLTLRVSITTTKIYFFLAMKIITRLHNRMKDNILSRSDCFIYILIVVYVCSLLYE